MASIFTYQDEITRLNSPWSTPGSSTPQIAVHVQGHVDTVESGEKPRLAKLEPEKHDGPIEYKLHLLLRWRRTFTYSSTSVATSNTQPYRDTAFTSLASTDERIPNRPSYQPSSQVRQARLQQLTTQLLWRLQQSSPFHSSSNATLVLPVLPEATPRLGVPDRPSKLLPGLEESQGALYEIGVADDGTLVGLSDEELEESLTNLRAMAASLGCVVDVHRRVIVGDCEWNEDAIGDSSPSHHWSKLWVAEVLVRPDNKSVEVVPTTDTENNIKVLDLEPASTTATHPEELSKQHLRVTLLGASAAGKSSLLGTLTTSVLDNGRGKSRLSLLKHRHEIASGITSSVAQELLGYQTFQPDAPAVINYATGDVSSWPDVHNLADRLVFLSDSPGLPRYAKSTFRALISWDPTWVMLCIPANAQLDANLAVTKVPTPGRVSNGEFTSALDTDLSLAHLELCLKLNRPLIVVITKMDLATKTGLRQVLAHVLSLTKAAGKSPVLINAALSQSSREESDFAHKINELVQDGQQLVDDKIRTAAAHGPEMVPIVMVSSLTGSGIGNLHCLLRSLPERPRSESAAITTKTAENQVIFRTDEVFAIPPSKVYSTSAERAVTDSGVVLCGILEAGTISLGDELLLGPFLVADTESTESLHIRALRRASSHHGKASSELMARSLSENFSKSLQLHGHHSPDLEVESSFHYVRVRVVSLRNLRLPVAVMRRGDTGTVGIETVHVDKAPNHAFHLNRARKGMILTQAIAKPQAYTTFTATFPHSDFGNSASPPLILGGHALVYVNSIRSAVKVIAVALGDDEPDYVNNKSTHKPTENNHDEVFSFDDDDEGEDNVSTNGIAPQNGSDSHLKISFRFVSTVEYLEKGDRVLVVPNVTAAGPISGPASTCTVAGLSGFVGRICEMSV